MRRPITAILLAAIVAAIAWWLWQWRGGEQAATDPWSAVPADAVAVLELPEPFSAWARFTGTSQFWGDLEGQPLFARMDSVLVRLGRQGVAHQGEQRKEQPLVIAWCPAASNRLAPLALWPLQRSGRALDALSTAFGRQVPEALWTGTRVTLPADSSLPALEMAWGQGLLVVGTEAAAVEKARTATGARPAFGPLFAKAKDSFSIGADAHLLVRGGTAAAMLEVDGRSIFPGLAAVEGWAAMDVRARPGAVLMNGLLFPDGDSRAVTAIRQQAPARPGIAAVLPASASELRNMQVADPLSFSRAILGQEPDQQLFEVYGAWVHGAIGTAREAGAEGMAWAVLGTEDASGAGAALRSRCPDGGCPETQYRGVAIARTADAGALAAVFGKDFADLDQPLWAALGERLVFAATPAAMRAAIDAWTDRNSLELDPRSADFFQRYASDAVYSWWVNAPRAYAPLDGPADSIRATLGDVLLQLSPRSDGPLITTCCIQHAPLPRQAAGTLWTAALPAPVAMGPVLVKDYLSKTLQVFAQDKDNRISLISCTGKILWQRQLDGPLVGGVEQIDRYRNGKLQLLCNTAGKVYLIDRLGRDVEGFPVSLKTTASAPLSVFDYDGKKDYRIIVPLADGDLLDLGADGKPVKGWAPAARSAPAMAAAEHVRIKGMDYIVVPRRDGRVSVLDRRGEVRYNAKLRMEGISEVLGSRPAMDIADRRILWADSAGNVLSGSLEGAVDTLSHATTGTASLAGPDADGRYTVLRTTRSVLTAEQGGKVLLRATFPDAPDARAFDAASGSTGEAIGLVLPGQEQLRLYQPDGTLQSGFPMKGAVRFAIADIDLDGTPELVTADGQGVVAAHALPPRD